MTGSGVTRLFDRRRTADYALANPPYALLRGVLVQSLSDYIDLLHFIT